MPRSRESIGGSGANAIGARRISFVGRQAELNLLNGLVAAAVNGTGSLAVMRGDAGIGKSRLTRALIDDAHRSGVGEAAGFCLEHARAPLAPIVDIVRALHAGEPAVLGALPATRAVLGRLIPEIDAGPSGGGEIEARAQYVALADALRAFGERRPRIVALEDADWADTATVEFVKFLSSRLERMRIVFIVMIRGDGVRQSAETAAMWSAVRRTNVVVLDIGPLPRSDMESLLRLVGGDALSVPRLRDVRDLAAGNPLFGEELVKSATTVAQAGQLPTTLTDVFAARVRQLADDDREIITTAAVVGRRFDLELLARISRLPIERVLVALRRARELSLIVEDPAVAEGAVFRHALVRETLYRSILGAEARRLHRRIADELEALPHDDAAITALAYHAWAARDHPRAADYGERAGDWARMQFAMSEAAMSYERALERTVDEADVARLRVKLGQAYSGCGLANRAIAAYLSAHEYYERIGDVRAMAEVAMMLGREHLIRADGTAAMRWRTAAYDVLPPDPNDVLKFEATTHVAMAYAKRGDTAAARMYLQRAQQSTAPRSEAAISNLDDAAAIVEALEGNVRDVFARYDRHFEALVAQRHYMLAVRAIGNMTEIALPLGFVDDARRTADLVVGIGEMLSDCMYYMYAHLTAAVVNVPMGRIDLARAQFIAAEDWAAGRDSPHLSAVLAQAAILLEAHIDEARAFGRYINDATIDEAFSSREPGWIAPIANVHADRLGRLGKGDAARALVERALHSVSNILYSPDLALTAAQYGDPRDFELARELLERWASVAAPGAAGAYLALFKAILAERSGRPATADAAAAARDFEALGLPFLAARAYELAGERTAAMQLYLRYGSQVNIARLGTHNTLAAHALTRREREVLTLVVDGGTNRDIANAMSISERTVESHIRSILSKVDGRSRADLIRFAREAALRPHRAV